MLQVYVLKGDYERAAAQMEKSKSLGWSSGEDPGVLGPFFSVCQMEFRKKIGREFI